MEEILDLKEIIGILRRHLVVILVSTLLGLILAGGWTFYLVTPEYSSRAQLIVSLPESEAGNLNDVNFNLQMLNTYKDIILQGDAQAFQVQERLKTEHGITKTPGEIKAALQVNQAQNSQMFTIEATTTNAEEAEMIANTTAEVFQDTVKNILIHVEEITIVSRAVVNPRPVSPNHQLNLAIGLVLGLMTGVFLSFILELLDRTVKNERYIVEALELPVLGIIPKISAKAMNVKRTQEILHPQMDAQKKNKKESKLSSKKTRQYRAKV